MVINPRWIVVDVISIPLLLLLVVASKVSATGGVFRVQHKFAGQHTSLTALKDHDKQRHQRLLFAVDIPLGGDGKPTGTGLYYTKIGIGTPSQDHYVHVDTGSDILWVNCAGCSNCPKKSGLGVHLKLYDPSSSATGQLIYCDQPFCLANKNGPDPGCTSGVRCGYSLQYGDGSSTVGYFVRDSIQYDRVSGNLATTTGNSSVIFGCGLQQTGNLVDPSTALDGILGFGQSSNSMMSQMAAAGSMKKMFAHCLDGTNGGGIFAMGNVVQPKVNTTPLVPNKPHYNINMVGINVGKDSLPIPAGGFGNETIVDSGTTLAYFPQEIYEPLISKIMLNHGDLNVRTVQEHFQCFDYTSSVDDGFPTVTLVFEGSLQLVVYPHDYLFKYEGNSYCIGWQNSGTELKDVVAMTILGDLVLSNKLVLYDIEKQALGWTEYNCSSTIGIQDEQSNSIYQVGAHDLTASSAHGQDMRSIMLLLLLSAIFQMLI